MANIITYEGKTPDIHHSVFLAVSADVIGDVVLAEGVNIWNHATIRGDFNYIRVGKYTNIQDSCIVHINAPNGDNPGPTVIGDYVTVGHGAIVHACTVEDYCLIGMGAIVLDGAVVGKGSIIGAGALVPPNAKIPPFSMVIGTPGRVTKTLLEESLNDRIAHAKRYYEYAKKY